MGYIELWMLLVDERHCNGPCSYPPSKRDLDLTESFYIRVVHRSLIVLGDFLYSEMLVELAKRERQAGIFPEKDVDIFMKVRGSCLSNLTISSGYHLKSCTVLASLV